MGVDAYQPTPKASATPKQTPELLMGDIAMPEPMPKQKEKKRNMKLVVGRAIMKKD
jgi:hypothetical protein